MYILYLLIFNIYIYIYLYISLTGAASEYCNLLEGTPSHVLNLLLLCNLHHQSQSQDVI